MIEFLVGLGLGWLLGLGSFAFFLAWYFRGGR